jgi:uncharacterized protein (DUF302 family)
MKLGNRLVSLLFAAILLAAAPWAAADDLLMVRSPNAFPEAMLALQEAIKEHGYTVSRVQRVDVGLTGSGFKTDKYRVVFFGKLEEMRPLIARYPQLIPYLPLHMTVFAEEDNTLVVSEDPTRLQALVSDEEVAHQFRRWRNDITSILDELRQEK